MPPERIVLIVIGALFLIWLAAIALYRVIADKVGDCEEKWADGYLQVEDPEYTDEKTAVVKFAVPIKSAGKQQCIIVDMFARVHPEGDRYLGMECRCLAYPVGNRRDDGYWEATLIKPEDTLIVKGEACFTSEEGNIREKLASVSPVKIDLFYKRYCRNVMEHKRKVIALPVKELEAPEEGRFVTEDKGQRALPVRTPLLTSDTDVYKVYEKYAKPHSKEGDIFAVCESALAIMEGRAYYVEDVKPGFLATHLNKLFKMDSSLSSPYSLQKAIEEVGAAKIILSVIIGGLGRLVGRKGDFYAFAGRAVATIDDCTGTLPPFDKYVVMGPKDPKRSAREFKEKTGVDMAVVDVNDLGKVDVLAISCPDRKAEVVEALKTNPQGNANEQTPVALIRK